VRRTKLRSLCHVTLTLQFSAEIKKWNNYCINGKNHTQMHKCNYREVVEEKAAAIAAMNRIYYILNHSSWSWYIRSNTPTQITISSMLCNISSCSFLANMNTLKPQFLFTRYDHTYNHSQFLCLIPTQLVSFFMDITLNKSRLRLKVRWINMLFTCLFFRETRFNSVAVTQSWHPNYRRQGCRGTVTWVGKLGKMINI